MNETNDLPSSFKGRQFCAYTRSKPNEEILDCNIDDRDPRGRGRQLG